MPLSPEILELAEKYREVKRFDRMDQYAPYPKQQEFHGARDSRGELARQRVLMAGNQVGKTYSGAMELAFHATGLYPDDWQGWRFAHPIMAWAGGQTNDTTRDIVQAELLGDPMDPEAFGTGSIPLHLIVGQPVRKPQVPGAVQTIVVKHVSGRNSVIRLKSYDQGKEAWMGKGVQVCWLDEEPPRDIYSQCLRATVRYGGIIFMTFTPENGMTETVAQFHTDIQPGQALVQMTWDDAPHLTLELREQILSALPMHERDMRSKGIPVLGSGMVFYVPEGEISKPLDFAIPSHWHRLAGIDFGMGHATAVVWAAFNRDANTIWIYDCYKRSGGIIAEHASAIKGRGDWIPVAWPHDGHTRDRQTGEGLAQQYRSEGVAMLPNHFHNPPDETNPKGGNSVEVGVSEMLSRFQTGRLRVAEHLTDFFTEYRMYHRVKGIIVKERDDLMSAARYAVMSLLCGYGEQKRTRTDLPRFAEGTMDYDPLAYGG